MRVLHVIHSIDPQNGGPSHVIRALIRAQIGAGLDVSLLATETSRSFDASQTAIREEEELRGCDAHLLNAWGRHKPWSSYAFAPAARTWLRRRLADPNRSPDVVHIHGVFGHVTGLAAAESVRSRTPFIVRPCGILDTHCLRSGGRWLKQCFLRLVLRRHLQTAAALHATSDSEASELARWVNPERIRTLPLGVEVKRLATTADVSRFFQRFPQLSGKRIVLFLGRITTKKRPELLVEALQCLRRSDPDFALLFVGNDDGGMAAVKAAVVRHELSKAVVYAGFLRGDERDVAFAASTVFALPSLDENFGVAVVEAMAAGLPVLVTPGVAAGKYVEASGGGLVVQGTAASIAEGIQRIVADEPQRVGQLGRTFVEHNLSLTSAIARIGELYRDIVLRAPHIEFGLQKQ